jgi:beta-galactosidase
MRSHASIWNHLPAPVASVQPKPFESYGQNQGLVLYRTKLVGRKAGRLVITDRVTLQGMTLMNWEAFLLPLSDAWVSALPAGDVDARPGTFFRGSFTLARPADTFIDTTGYRKGVVWVNGHNLGRYWDVGPQKRLYCPASWLKAGANDVVVFDLHQTVAAPLRGAPSLE